MRRHSWSQIENILNAANAQDRLRRNSLSLGMFAAVTSGIDDCQSFSIANYPKNNNLTGLPTAADSKQLKI